METQPVPSVGKIIAMMALFVLAGVPLVAYLWETLNHLLALEADPVRLLIAVPVLLVLLGLLALMARLLRRWAGPESANT